MSAYLLVSLHANTLHRPQVQPSSQRDAQPQAIALKLAQHPGWKQANGWKQALNNLRLVIQPSVMREFARTLVESISNPATVSGIRVFSCTDESLPRQLAKPRATRRFLLFFCLE